jgi:hypothetical protein
MDTNTINSSANPSAVSAPVRSWPVVALALPAFVAIWSGWVGLGGMTGFGKVNPLPGTPFADWTLDTSITLPIGMEVYAAYALQVWLSQSLPERARRFGKWSAIGALFLGAAGQVAYHLMAAAGIASAPWQITTVVACLPVAVLGMGAALHHLIREGAAIPAAAEPPGDVNASKPKREPGKGTSDARRRGGRPPGATGTGATVTRLRARYPDWTVPQIAAKAGVSARTARRYLNARPDDAARAESDDAAA